MGQLDVDSGVLRRWKDILWRTYQRTSDDRLLAVAAGVVFLRAFGAFSSHNGSRFIVWPVRNALDDQRAFVDGKWILAVRRERHRTGTGEPPRAERQCEA